MSRKRGWGEGSIEKLPSGWIRARLPAGNNPVTGKRDRPSKSFPKETDARAWLREQVALRDKGHAPAVGSQTLEEWSVEWLAGKELSTGAGNYRNYEAHFRVHILPGLGAYKLRELTPAVLKKWQLERTRAEDPVSRPVLTTLATSLNDAVAEGKIASNPMAKIPRPKKAMPEIEFFAEAEVRSILVAAEPHRGAEALFTLLFDTGMRPGEAFGLQWPDVDPTGSIRIRRSLEQIEGKPPKLKEPKTKAGKRTITLSSASRVILESHRGAMGKEGKDTVRGHVFLTAEGEHPTRDEYRALWKRILKAAKVPHRKPYATRHTSAAMLLARGVNIRTISRRLGHEDIATTLRHYAGLMPDADEKAAAVMGELLGKG